MMLIVLVFLLALALTTYIIHALNSSTIQTERNKKTFDALAQAKSALIGWSVNHPNLPGMMPFPDRNGDGDYDGKSDCYSGAFSYGFLLGQLPWAGQTNPCVTPQTGLGVDIRDGSGERLWYAVSRNLVRDYQTSTDPVINPGKINTPTYPWMIVLDKRGNVVSDRVAAVIIAPGAPLDNQDRSGGIANPTEYLDSFQIGAATYSNKTYSLLPDEDFVIGEDSSAVRSDDTSYQQPYRFNDKLVYITIDELMAEIEKRVAGEAKAALKSYNTAHGFFPYAAPLGTSSGYSCQDNNLLGMLPTGSGGGAVSCTCASATSCSCPFSLISSVAFKRSGTSTWSFSSGACTRTPTTQSCTCTGAGQCRSLSGTRHFDCDAAGNCTVTIATGTYTFNGAFTTASVSSYTGGCSYNCSTKVVTCSAAGTFSSATCSDPAFNSFLTSLPWFTANNWQDYLYYQLSRATPTLTVGSITGVQALLAATSRPIATAPYAVSKGSAQNRPSCSVNDYLDSVENANADLVFDAGNTARGSKYNDQVFIVAP